mgnify:FL=1|jgi:hypothetical protein|tara:strand:- start:289 stop:597 length:309 start_codon:yes stop_codon:yes gene_type:complete
MKITRGRLKEIVKEELLRETNLFNIPNDPDQGVDPDDADISGAVFNLEKARAIIARALPELLEQLDYVITKMKDYGMYPPEATMPYTVYEEESTTDGGDSEE